MKLATIQIQSSDLVQLSVETSEQRDRLVLAVAGGAFLCTVREYTEILTHRTDLPTWRSYADALRITLTESAPTLKGWNNVKIARTEDGSEYWVERMTSSCLAPAVA